MLKYDKPMMDTAIIWSEMSSCTRRKVGCVIAKDGRVISNGYNGTISGMNNNCEDEKLYCPTCREYLDINVYKENDVHCIGSVVVKTLVTSDFTLHAEQNAITHAAKLGISLDGATMYVTTSPCTTCSKLIAQSGITRVVYLNEYKDTSGIDFLHKCKIKTVKYLPDVHNLNIRYTNVIFTGHVEKHGLSNTVPDDLVKLGGIFIDNSLWYIPNQIYNSLEQILLCIQSEYENPYIITRLELNNDNPNDIHYNWVVIVDFILDVSKYDDL